VYIQNVKYKTESKLFSITHHPVLTFSFFSFSLKWWVRAYLLQQNTHPEVSRSRRQNLLYLDTHHGFES